jgi:NAD(P)H-hydrate epimerase
MGTSVQADYTITFGLPKVGNLLYPGYGRGGKLFTTHISFPPSLYDSEILKVEIPHPLTLPERVPNTTKMDYGPVLVIAGAANYFWAPHASAYSVLKAGGGYVYLACPRSIAASVSQSGKEVVFVPQDETNAGSIALINKDFLLELASRMRMVILGPGLSLNDETQSLVRELVKEIHKPLLIDGDGITAVSHNIELIQERKEVTILTPHPGEMSRLSGIEREEIENDQVHLLQEVAEKLKAIIVLKGAHSLIGYPDRRMCINVTGATGGRAGMATAGSGDVLNGTIAAMYCLGLSVEDAVRTGVFVHGLAGDMAAEEKGSDGMTAQDTMDYLPYAVQYYRENLSDIAENFYNTVHFV